MKRLALIIALLLIPAITSQSAHNRPTNNRRVRVYADADKPVVLSSSPDTVILKVSLSALDSELTTKRLPLNIAIVLDKSGSMGSQQKIENAKSAAIEIVERLNKNDVVSLVVYDNNPRVLIPAQHLKNKDKFIRLISGITADGSTALYGGVTYGADEIRKYSSDEYFNRILLLSDGLANVGPQSTEELAQLGLSLNEEGISVSTVGVGLDYNEDLMAALADRSHGNSYFARSSDELPEIFAQEVGEAMTLVAKQVHISIECNDGIEPVAIIGRKGTISGQRITTTIGNLYGKNEKYALFEVKIPARTRRGNAEIARVSVEYVDALTKDTINERQAINIKYTDKQRFVDKNLNKNIIKEVALTRTSEVKQQAISLADKGKIKEATALLNRQGVELEKVAKQCDNDAELQEEALKNNSMANEMKTEQRLNKFNRKMMMNDAQTQTTQQYYVPQKGSWGAR